MTDGKGFCVNIEFFAVVCSLSISFISSLLILFFFLSLYICYSFLFFFIFWEEDSHYYRCHYGTRLEDFKI